MGKKLTKEIVLTRFYGAHGDIYDYSKFEFAGVDSKIEIICRQHGSFRQTPYRHWKGQGCPACGHELRNKTKFERLSKSFVSESQKVHGDKYDYSKFVYVSATTKGIIICKLHGKFLQNPNKHKRGRGCPRCAQESYDKQQDKGADFENFRVKCLSVGRSELEIKNCGFLKMKKKVKFFCHVHGHYSLIGSRASAGVGCPKCSDVRTGLLRNGDTAWFVEKAIRVHGNSSKTSYPRTHYVNAKTKVTLTCQTHGDYEQVASSHLMGCGCPKCFGGPSKEEVDLADFVASMVSIERNDRNLLEAYGKGGLEIDILAGSLGIEYNGNYFHSERLERTNSRKKGWARKHMLNKQTLCDGLGVELLHVLSTDPKTVIKKLLAQRVGYDPERYYARSCEVRKDVESGGINEFYRDNHVQGPAKGCITYCLTMRGEIVAAMSFSSVTSEIGKYKSDRYELRRFATCCRVVGGASRLLKAFIRDHQSFSEIISYSDNRLFTGKMYSAIGFDLVNESGPGYSYTKANKTIRKAKFQHKYLNKMEGFEYDPNLSEKQNCEANGWFRIWDCGKKKWSLKP